MTNEKTGAVVGNSRVKTVAIFYRSNEDGQDWK